MANQFLVASVLCLALFELCYAGGHGGGHKKVIIHVPYKVKTIHHTHTVYKHIGGGEKEGGKSAIIGYSGDGDVSLGHGEEVHADVGGGEHAGGFTVGGDHGYWHSGGHGDGGEEAAIHLDVASSGGHHDWSGASASSGGGHDWSAAAASHGDLGLGAYSGGDGGDHLNAGYDLGGAAESYGNSISSGHDEHLGGSYGGGDSGGFKGYD